MENEVVQEEIEEVKKSIKNSQFLYFITFLLFAAGNALFLLLYFLKIFSFEEATVFLLFNIAGILNMTNGKKYFFS